MVFKRVLLAACALAPLMLGAALAEDFNAGPTFGSAEAAKVEDKGPDLTALRYYARQHDQTRVAAEIRRIRVERPGWTPPGDLYADPKSIVDEQPLWDLYAKGDFLAVDGKIAEMSKANPGWTPSKDFTEKLAHAKIAQAIVEKSDAKAYDEVAKLALSQAGVVNCDEFDLAWRVAEGFARAGGEDRAFNVYRFLLTTCNAEKERLATAGKAFDALQDRAKLDAIMALGRKTVGGVSEFADLAWNKARSQLGGYAGGTNTTAATAAELEPFEAAVKANHKTADQLLLGWYYRKLGQPDKALDWMLAAYQGAHDVKTAEGLALALREDNKFADAEALTYEWRDKGPHFREMYIDIVSTSITAHGHDDEVVKRQSTAETAAQAPVAKELAGSKGDVYGQSLDKPKVYCGEQRPLTAAEIERLQRFKAEVEIAKSALGAQALGWRLYEANLTTDAAQWFEQSVVWAPNEPAVTGLVVTAKKLKRLDVYRALVVRYGSTYPSLLRPQVRGCSTTTTAGHVAPASSAPGALFSAVLHLPTPNAPAVAPEGALKPTAAAVVPVVPAAPAVPAAAMPKNLNGLLAPSGLTGAKAGETTPQVTLR